MGPKMTQDWPKMPFFFLFLGIIFGVFAKTSLKTVQTFLMGRKFHGYLDCYDLERHGAAISVKL